ncbi:MAG TPA: aminoglycoside phosphotransferase family protein [Gemmatimonadaceae bacterium]|nr:aminoglycoside phosphotransferase family protein [Gemmatimonadaceae bacterium]
MSTDAEPEARSQTPAPLRAADWRFLLPLIPGETPDHLALVGGVPGVVERATELGLARRITEGLPPPGSADIVVAAADAPDAVEEIAGAVADGGVLYLEVDRRRRGYRATTPARITAALAAAGLPLVTIYAVEPDLAEPRVFIPVDATNARTWFRRTFVNERALESRLWDIARKSSPGAAILRDLTIREHYVVVAASRGTATVGLLRHPEVSGIFADMAEAESAIMLTYGGDRAVLFPFARRSPAPLAVLKVPKTPQFVGRTENEQAYMRALHARLAPALARVIPAPLGTAHAGALSIACEQFLPGEPLAKRARSRTLPLSMKIDDLRRAMAWLAAFHRATEVRRLAPHDDARRQVIEQPLRDYARELGATSEEARLFGRVSAAVSHATGSGLPIVCHHRDYAAWNLLRDADELAVLDWEGAREGPAVCDALHLATSWLYTLRLGAGSDDEVGCVHDLFVSLGRPDPAVQAATTAVDDYLTELGIDRVLLPQLVVHHRVELALRRLDQRRLQNEAGPDAARTTVEVDTVRMLAAAVERLFARVDIRT